MSELPFEVSGERMHFSINGTWQLCIHIQEKEVKLDMYITLYTNIYIRQIKNINVKDQP